MLLAAPVRQYTDTQTDCFARRSSRRPAQPNGTRLHSSRSTCSSFETLVTKPCTWYRRKHTYRFPLRARVGSPSRRTFHDEPSCSGCSTGIAATIPTPSSRHRCSRRRHRKATPGARPFGALLCAPPHLGTDHASEIRSKQGTDAGGDCTAFAPIIRLP